MDVPLVRSLVWNQPGYNTLVLGNLDLCAAFNFVE
jgi:hypothetical protein